MEDGRRGKKKGRVADEICANLVKLLFGEVGGQGQ